MEDGFATKVAILNRPKKLNAVNETMVNDNFLSHRIRLFVVFLETFPEIASSLHMIFYRIMEEIDERVKELCSVEGCHSD